MSKTTTLHVCYIYVHFFAVLCKTRTWNDHILRSLRNVKTRANISYFHLELTPVIAYLAWARLKSHWRTEQI